jgi:hypothetical protein
MAASGAIAALVAALVFLALFAAARWEVVVRAGAGAARRRGDGGPSVCHRRSAPTARPTLDRGWDAAPGIRRVVVAGQLLLPRLHEPVQRVHLDLAMAGAEVGWEPVAPPSEPARLEATVHAKMAGLRLTVPPGSLVWWRSRGPGGVTLDRAADLSRADPRQAADVRVEAVLVFAGVSITTP